MTTEDDFQRALDADPADWQTRLVLADFLDERDDPRAAGYRALGHLRRYPKLSPNAPEQYSWEWWRLMDYPDDPDSLPDDWIVLLSRHGRVWGAKDDTPGLSDSKDYPSRRAAEDDAALAFGLLSHRRQEELLSPNVPT